MPRPSGVGGEEAEPIFLTRGWLNATLTQRNYSVLSAYHGQNVLLTTTLEVIRDLWNSHCKGEGDHG